MAPDRTRPHDTPTSLADDDAVAVTELAVQRRSADELFQLLVDSVKDYAIFMLDRLGRVATWNPGAERAKGYRPDEILGRHFSIFYPPADVAAGKCEYELEVAARTGRFEEEGWRIRKDGSRFWASVVISAVHDDGGALIGFAKVTRDLSERRAAAAAEHAGDERFRLLVESVRDYAIFMLDVEGRVVTWNAGAERFKGYRADEIIGQHFSVFYPREEVAAGKCEHELEVAAREGRLEDEGWRVRKDGTRFWANVVITALRDATGALVGFGKVTRDLTERKLGEEQRRVAEARLGLLLESVKDYAIFMLDPEGRVASWNPGAQRIKGYRAEEILGHHFSRFVPEEDVRAGKCEHELTVAAREGRFEDEGWRVRKDGSRFWANVVISAVRDELGNLVGFSKVTRDLTDRIRAEQERAGRLAAEQASRTKDEFLAMLGHELRNPLAPIVSAIQLLKLRGDARSAREHGVIERQVHQMIRLVDDLLDVSRVASGKIVLKRERIDLRDVLARAAEIAIPAFDKHGQHFAVHVPHHALQVDGDDARLVQVFANLLTNASKYTPQGGHVALDVRHTGNAIVVTVEDDGRGIEPALLPRIFELFVQGYQDVNRADGGLGLGLTLVRSLVEMHGGAVEAQSRGKGLGSCFVVRLPALEANLEPDAEAAEARAPLAASRAARRVLVVDDNEDARSLLAEMLVALGHEVKCAGEARAALHVLESFRPDLAILDIGLPGMDGFELVGRIRALPGGEAMRVIALSGYGQPDDRALGARAGFDAYLVKPVELARLQAELRASRP